MGPESGTHDGGFSLVGNFLKKGLAFWSPRPHYSGPFGCPPNNQRSADVQREVLTSRSIREGFPAQNARHRRESSLWGVGAVVGLMKPGSPGRYPIG